MTALDWIFQRRSIRKYLSTMPSDDQLEHLLQAGMAAPSAMNMKPWRFILVKDPAILQKIRTTLFFGKMDAPCAISVCGDLRKSTSRVERFWIQDCSAATQNILLAAASLGLGTVWCGVYPIHSYVKKITSILALPENVLPLNVIYVGFPAESKPSRTQYDNKNISLDRFDKPWVKQDIN